MRFVAARGRYDDRVMEFVLMKLEFFDDEREPQFSELAVFKTIGVVMNVFLLDPSSRLLSAFVWVSSSNTIGLYALLDWKKSEYVFIDTGVECVRTALRGTVNKTLISSVCSRYRRIGHVFYTRGRS